MRTAIRKYFRDFAAIVALAVIALGVGGYILSNQRFYLPKWFPLLGSDFVTLKAEMTTAQSVTPARARWSRSRVCRWARSPRSPWSTAAR